MEIRQAPPENTFTPPPLSAASSGFPGLTERTEGLEGAGRAVRAVRAASAERAVRVVCAARYYLKMSTSPRAVSLTTVSGLASC